MDSCLALSALNTGVTPHTYDKVLTLSTCTGNGHATRWVVQAVCPGQAPETPETPETPQEEPTPQPDASQPEESVQTPDVSQESPAEPEQPQEPEPAPSQDIRPEETA